MHSHLAVTTAAASLELLSVEERRDAIGVTVATYDTALATWEKRVAAAIMVECGIAIGASSPPTLLQETLTETFRAVCTTDVIVLSRRHEITITSITVDGDALDAADYWVDPESGLLHRLCDDYPSTWSANKLVVVYQAGFGTIPDDLKMAAADFLRLVWGEKDRDPAIRAERVNIPDVEEREVTYWAGALPGIGEGAVPDVVAGQLTRFRNYSV